MKATEFKNDAHAKVKKFIERNIRGIKKINLISVHKIMSVF